MSSVSISVALPVHNGANYLHEALESVLAQDLPDFELIVSDNCSTDDTPAILARYARLDRRLRVSRASEFLPQADNVNRAVGLCSREWVKIFCHDDIMRPNCLSTIAHAIGDDVNESIGLIGNGESWLFANGYRLAADPDHSGADRAFAGRDIVRRTIVGRDAPPLPSLTTATIRRRAWQYSGGFDARFVHFDAFFWLKVLMTSNYLWVPPPLTINRIHPAQVAVSARKSLRSVADHRLFWSEFVARHGHELDLDRVARTMLRMKPLAVAASAIAIELLRRKPHDAARILLRIPTTWWPLLPLFITRSLRRERHKLERLRGAVPIEMIYP